MARRFGRNKLRLPALGLAVAISCLSQLAAGTATAQSADKSAGKPAAMPLAERIEQCGACHGKDGNSGLEAIPSLAGQPAFFILNQLFLIREGVRPVEAMAPFVKDLTDDVIDALSKHYAALAPKPTSETVDPGLVERGAGLADRLRCASCHLPTFAGQEQMPRLARQRIDYLAKALRDLRDNQRPGADSNMTGVVTGLSAADLSALAHYATSK